MSITKIKDAYLKITELKLVNINGIPELNLTFNDSLNLICGPNGIGKTTILDSIAQSFCTASAFQLKKRAGTTNGQIEIKYSENETIHQSTYTTNTFSPFERENSNGLFQKARDIILIHSNRFFVHQVLNSIEKDPVVQENNVHGRLAGGILSNEIKKWFINRFLFSTHANSLSQEQLANLELAKKCFSSLDPRVSFSKVDASSFDIYLNSPSGEIPFEYLSSGYKSTLVILLGLIKEIEYRFKNPQINAVDYSSIFLIDEIDVHLHPEWQAKLVLSLKYIFPQAQIIATTHSPHIIQVCLPSEIIALEYDENSKVRQRKLDSNLYGFQGWNLEEILIDVMGMTTTKSNLFNTTLKNFELALSNDDATSVITHGEKLQEMLHPNNELGKIISIQMAPFKP